MRHHGPAGCCSSRYASRPPRSCCAEPSASRAAGGMAKMWAATTISRAPARARGSGCFTIGVSASGTCRDCGRERWSLSDYAELHTLSNFSFLRGASHPAELIGRAHALGYRALALTDECSLAGVVRAHEALQALQQHADFKLIIGAEFSTVCGMKLILLAPQQQAYGQICQLITLGRRRSKKGEYRLLRADFESGL